MAKRTTLADVAKVAGDYAEKNILFQIQCHSYSYEWYRNGVMPAVVVNGNLECFMDYHQRESGYLF